MKQLTAALTSLAVLCSSLAAADSKPALSPQAQEHFDAAAAAYEAKDYDAASKEFDAVFQLTNDSTYLFSWAQSERLAHRCRHAIELYDQYLRVQDISEDARDLARDRRAECERELPAMTDRDRPWYRDPLGGALAVTGLVSLVVGGVYLAKSSGSARDASVAPDLEMHDALADTATSQRRIGAVALLVGLGATGFATYRFVTAYRRQHPSTTVTPVLGPEGAAVLVGGHF